MNIYVDTSALIKRYTPEPASQLARATLDAADFLATSNVTRAEIAATLARKCRRYNPPGLTGAEALAAYQQFFLEWPQLIRIRADDVLCDHAEELAWRHALRGYDAVHLASALAFRDLIRDEVVVATFDEELWAAGRAEGLRTWPDDILAALQQP